MRRRPEHRPRVRVPAGALRAERLRLPDDAAHHVRTVLRARAGDRLEAFDGEGEGASAEIVRVAADGVEIRVLGPAGAERESPLEIVLAVALTRAAKLDGVVEKATELGVSAILPFAAERSIAGDGRVERWRRIAESAAAQSGRVRTPRIELVDFPGALSAARSSELRLLLWERSETPLPREAAPRSVFLVTGPEGGFSTEEVALATDAGFRVIGLGPRILRAETAAVAAVTLAGLFWGDLGDG